MSSNLVNPFLKNQINSAWEKPSDVQSINNQITEQIIKTTETNDQGSIVQMLIGAPGSGKTHLLTRLWKHALLKRSFLFVAIPPPGDISRINVHILREFISSLLEQGEHDSLLPLDIFLTEILRTILIKTLPQEQQSVIDRIRNSKTEDLFKLLTKSDNKNVFINHSLTNFSKVFPDTDIQLSQSLFALLDPFRKLYALKWFQGGELTEQEKRTLNIGTKVIDENIAISFAKSLIKLSPLPVLITIDQMESTYYRFKKDGLIQLLDNSIALLQNSARLFLLFIVQTQEWIDNIRVLLPRYIIDRISKIMPIKPLNQKESFEIAILRLNKFQMSVDTVFLQQKEFYPFSRDYVSRTHSSAGGNPRKFLNMLRDAFDFAQKSNFNPNWEKEFEKIEFEKEKTLPAISVENFISYFDNTLQSEIKNIDFNIIPLEKLRELEKGTFLQIIKESLEIHYLQTLPTEAIHVNALINEVTFDIVINFSVFSPNPVGIIFSNQKNILFFQGVLEQVLSIPDFSKIIIFRSDSLKPVDQTPGIKNAIQVLSTDSRIMFNYIPIEVEKQIIASKRMLDSSKDFSLGSITTTPELILWYVIHHILSIENLTNNIFESQMIINLLERLQNRISQSLMQISHSTSKSIRQWQSSIKTSNLALVTNQGQGVEIGFIFSYLQNSSDDSLTWGVFRGSGLTSLKTFVSCFIKQLNLNWDPFSTFIFSSNNNLTSLFEMSMSDIVTQYGHGIHLTQSEDINIPIESSVLGFIAYFRDIFTHVLPNQPLTPEALLKQTEAKDIPVTVLSSLAQLLGHLFNVTFRNGQIYSLSSDLPFSKEPVTQSSVAQIFEEKTEVTFETIREKRDILDIAEEKGDVQRIWDENVIELTSRLQKFNLSIDPNDYEILTAILNYSKVSPDKLTPLMKGLVTEFGDVSQKSSFKSIQRKIDLEDIEHQILSNYQPFKEKWIFIKSMPPLIGKLGAQFFSTGYRLNAFTLLDFHSIEINQNWHELISRSTKSFVKTNIEIQQLSEHYYTQKFESESKTLLLPIVNRYQSLILEESDLIQKRNPQNSETRTNEFLDLSRHISEWWMILEAFNRVVGFEFHLDNRQFMDEILIRFENEFKDNINYISTDPFNFTILFENALELMSIDSDRLIQTIETRSKLSLVQVNLYSTFINKQYRGAPEEITDEYSFWKSFYLAQINDFSYINDYSRVILQKLKLLSNEFKTDEYSGIILLQLILPALVFSQIKTRKLESLLLAFVHHLALKNESSSVTITNVLVHLLEMSMLLPRLEQGTPTIEIQLDNIKDIFPYNTPLFKPFEKSKIKIQQTLSFMFGSKLPAEITEKIVLKTVVDLGLEFKEEKVQKEGKKSIFKGLISEDMKLELQLMFVPSTNNKTVFQIISGWECKNVDQMNDINQLVLSAIVMQLVLEKEYLTLDDKAFVVYCAGCGYQINILKTGVALFLVDCKNCNTKNIIAPNVYKIIKDVLK